MLILLAKVEHFELGQSDAGPNVGQLIVWRVQFFQTGEAAESIEGAQRAVGHPQLCQFAHADA